MNTLTRIMAASAAFCSIAACTRGPGHCIGEGAAVETASQKVLVNLNASGVAIEGYDPVAYFSDAKAIPGDARFRSATAPRPPRSTPSRPSIPSTGKSSRAACCFSTTNGPGMPGTRTPRTTWSRPTTTGPA